MSDRNQSSLITLVVVFPAVAVYCKLQHIMYDLNQGNQSSLLTLVVSSALFARRRRGAVYCNFQPTHHVRVRASGPILS